MSAEISSRTQMSGRWLALARLAWVILATVTIGSFLVTIPMRFTETSQFTSAEDGITPAEYINGLTQMGISPVSYSALQRWSSVVIPCFYIALGIFIFWRKSNDGIAILTSLLLIVFFNSYGQLARLNPAWAVVGNIFDLVTSVVLFLWFFIFPDGHFVPRWMSSVFFLLLATQIWGVFQPDVYQKSFALLIFVIFGGVLLAQVFRYRHSGTAQRQQIKWVVFGIVIGTIPVLLFGFYYSAVLSSQPPLARAIAFNFWGNWLWMFFVIVFPISLTLAILRSRLFDIDVIIRKTLVYSVLTALLAVIYFGGVVLLQQFTRSFTETSDLAIVVSTLVIAALFFPLRRRVQNAIDRRFYRRKYDAAKTLAAFSTTVRDEVELEKLTAELLKVVNETMQPASVSLWLKSTDDQGRRATP